MPTKLDWGVYSFNSLKKERSTMRINEEKTEGSLLADLLLTLFIGLKLGGVITWSWWWVMSPLWISVVVHTPLVLLLAFLKGHKK